VDQRERRTAAELGDEHASSVDLDASYAQLHAAQGTSTRR
jgi:hypothetical protein